MKLSNNPSSRRSRGFTVLEVLVACAIMGIVLFVLVSTANTSLTLWRDTRDKIAVNQEGRTGVNILDRDLKNLIQPAKINLRPNLASQGNAFTPLKFLTVSPIDYQKSIDSSGASDEKLIGDVCYVEYRFKDNALLRGSVSSNGTFEALKTGQFPTVPNDQFELVATNLFQFKVWGYQADKTPIKYPDAGGEQEAGKVLQTIEYRIETVDPKFLKLFFQDEKFRNALKYKTRKYFESMTTVSPPMASP
jgi:prepilin-type N-terminal cleavage/methylation domain-containing protein